MIQSTKFKHINSPFLDKLKEDAIKIVNEAKLLIAADKTTNFYKLEPPAYNDVLDRTSPRPTKKHNLILYKPSTQKTRTSQQNWV